MAAKLAELEQTAYQLAGDVERLCPGAYREWQVGWEEDDYGAVWFQAVAATRRAADVVDYVLGLCEEKAFGEEEAEDRDSARMVKRGEWPPGLAVSESVQRWLNPSPSDIGSPRACVREGVAPGEK
jgi:hypothetical protein